MFKNLVNERLLKDEKRKEFLSTQFLRSSSDSSFSLSLYDLYLNQQKNRSAIFHNKLNTLYKFNSEYNYSTFFITITFSKGVHSSFKKLKNDNDRLSHISAQKDYFQDFWNSFLKSRLFRKGKLDKQNRYYLKSLEFHKSKVLHFHVAFFLNSSYSLEFIKLFDSFIKRYDKFGRVEFVLDKSFIPLISSEVSHLIKRKGMYMFNDSDFKSGQFLYFKPLDDSKSDGQHIYRYITKYVSKNFKSTLDNSDIDRVLFLKLGIRNIVFSNFLFPYYLFKSLKKRCGDADINIYNYYDLYDLTVLKHSGVLKVHKTFEFLPELSFDLIDLSDVSYDSSLFSDFFNQFDSEFLKYYFKDRYKYFNTSLFYILNPQSLYLNFVKDCQSVYVQYQIEFNLVKSYKFIFIDDIYFRQYKSTYFVVNSLSFLRNC